MSDALNANRRKFIVDSSANEDMRKAIKCYLIRGSKPKTFAWRVLVFMLDFVQFGLSQLIHTHPLRQVRAQASYLIFIRTALVRLMRITNVSFIRESVPSGGKLAASIRGDGIKRQA